jgi:hypothetical protein
LTQILRFTAPIELTAASAGPRKIRVVGYTGGTMKINGWGSIAIEMSGIKMPSTLPFLVCHEATLDSLAGQGRPSIERGELIVNGTLAPGPAGDRVEQLLAAGVQLQASVGGNCIRTSFVNRSGEAKVNGRDVAAGVTIVHEFDLAEMSIVPIGADRSTSVSIAAHAAGARRMEFDAWAASLGVTVTDANRGQLQATHTQLFPPPERPASTAELETVLAGDTSPLLARAMTEAWTLPRAKSEALTFIRASRPKVTGFITNGSGGTDAMNTNHLAAGFMVRAGYHNAVEKAFGPHVMEQSRPFHRMSFVDLCKASLSIDGVSAPSDRDAMIRAGVSTGSLAIALGSSADKILEATWNAAPPTWQSFCAIRSAPNFREQTGLKPAWAGDLQEVGVNGEVKHGTYSESTYEWQLGQYAKQYQIDRKAIINDDLSIFSDLVPGLGKAALRTLSNLVYTILLANGGNFFHANNANLETGGGSALSATSLGLLVKKMRIQKDPDGNDLDLAPVTLLAPPELEVPARGYLQSAELNRDASEDMQPTGNTFQNLAKLEIESRLSNSAFTGYSATAWYLFAAAGEMPMVVGFLDGKRTPTVETFDFRHDINTLAMGFRIVHDFGAALGEYRAAQKSAGA